MSTSQKNSLIKSVFSFFLKRKIDINQNVDINETDGNGMTLLHYVSALGDKTVVQQLLDLGANTTIKNNRHETPLKLSAKLGNHLIVKSLMDFTCDNTDHSLKLSNMTAYAKKTDGIMSGGLYHDAQDEKWMIKSSYVNEHSLSESILTEYVAGGLYKAILGDYSPQVELVYDDTHAQLHIASKLLAEFEPLKNYFDSNNTVEMTYNGIPIKGFMNVISAILFLADSDGHHGNIGLIKGNNEFYCAKVDHSYALHTNTNVDLDSVRTELRNFHNIQDIEAFNFDEVYQSFQNILIHPFDVYQDIVHKKLEAVQTAMSIVQLDELNVYYLKSAPLEEMLQAFENEVITSLESRYNEISKLVNYMLLEHSIYTHNSEELITAIKQGATLDAAFSPFYNVTVTPEYPSCDFMYRGVYTEKTTGKKLAETYWPEILTLSLPDAEPHQKINYFEQNFNHKNSFTSEAEQQNFKTHIPENIELSLTFFDESIDVNYQNDSGMTLLHLASIMGDISLMKEVIDLGVDVRLKNQYNKTALDIAAILKNQPAVKMLIQSDLNFESHFKFISDMKPQDQNIYSDLLGDKWFVVPHEPYDEKTPRKAIMQYIGGAIYHLTQEKYSPPVDLIIDDEVAELKVAYKEFDNFITYYPEQNSIERQNKNNLVVEDTDLIGANLFIGDLFLNQDSIGFINDNENLHVINRFNNYPDLPGYFDSHEITLDMARVYTLFNVHIYGDRTIEQYSFEKIYDGLTNILELPIETYLEEVKLRSNNVKALCSILQLNDMDQIYHQDNINNEAIEPDIASLENLISSRLETRYHEISELAKDMLLEKAIYDHDLDSLSKLFDNGARLDKEFHPFFKPTYTHSVSDCRLDIYEKAETMKITGQALASEVWPELDVLISVHDVLDFSVVNDTHFENVRLGTQPLKQYGELDNVTSYDFG